MPAAAATTTSDRIHISACPVCGTRDFRPFVTVGPYSVVRCPSCRLAITNPQPSDRELGEIYGPDYVLVENDPVGEAMVLRSKRATADHYLDLLAAAGVPSTGKLLEIGCGAGNFLRQAAARGFDITGLEYSPYAAERARKTLEGRGRILHGEIGVLAAERDAYDVVVLCDVIEHVRHPADFLRDLHRLLKPGGTLLVVTPSLDSWSARVLGSRWMEFKAEHLYYFSPSTISRQLTGAGYERIALHSGTKKLCLDYIAAHFKKYPVSVVTPLVSFLHALTPAPLSNRLFSIVASGLVALARKPGAPA